MRINKVTITGADDKVSAEELLQLQNEFPFVEWGILFSTSKEGSQRYPKLQKVMDFIAQELNLSAHLCGKWSRDILEKSDFGFLESDWFSRIQLNYNFSTEKANLFELIYFAEKNLQNDIILQYNRNNKKAMDSILGLTLPKNIHFLYDDSGGHGTAISGIAEPFKNYTGYAGGINIDNIENICQSIKSGFKDQDLTDVWIDLESGARIDNEFNIPLVRQLLEKASKFI